VSRRDAQSESLVLQAKLQKLHSREHCLLTANGTTALYLALKAVGLSGARVGIPAGVCLNVPLAVLYSGNHPVYLDIDEGTLGLSARSVAAGGPLQAVIIVHAYGAVSPIEEIENYCGPKGILVIEDAAVAQGASVRGRPAGSFGTASVLSFGTGKITAVGSGGALLSNDANLIGEATRLLANLPAARDESALQEFSRDHTRLYNMHYGKRELAPHAALLRSRALALQDAFVHRCDEAFVPAVMKALSGLASNIDRRRRRADHVRDLVRGLGEGEVRYWDPPAGSVPWRAILFLPSVVRDEVLKRLLRVPLNASSWYPPASMFLEPEYVDLPPVPTATKVGDTILNLWVNDEVDDDYPSAAMHELSAALKAK
jgi:dTDP-4-amino-4,6-dideoxygalactose transaminase